MKYEITVGNIGTVYVGFNKITALDTFQEYVSRSKTNVGRAGGESVTMLKNGEIAKEYVGTVDKMSN